MNKYDAIVIGLGPAGMAIAGMAPLMGLKVLAIESHKVGGECLNYGCIPSKAMLKIGEVAYSTKKLDFFGLKSTSEITSSAPMDNVRTKTPKINNQMAEKMFPGVDLIIDKGLASFVDSHTVEVDGEKYEGKTIFIATGTEPFIPPIPGIQDVPILTNQNVFALEEVPESLTIIGGGAIGSELAQAFSRLGSKVTVVQKNSFLVPIGDEEAGHVLEDQFKKEGIKVFNDTQIEKVEQKNNKIYTHTTNGVLESDKLLVATGRQPVLEPLNLEKAGIDFDKRGIIVDEYNKTSQPHIFALGDCNGKSLLSHAAMHQSMLSLMSMFTPEPAESLKRSNHLVPWAVFTKPEIAQVGMTEREVKEKGTDYIVVKEDYANYTRAASEGHTTGFVKVITDLRGTIYGVTICGEAGSELIHEWVLAMQNRLTMFNIVMMQHTFPTLSLLNKRVAEQWMMTMMQNGAMEEMMKQIK
ncbi:NAD(P)/FAD-dependent oxidoreductase [Serpentinicella sp. ANB-PHB4]|uniref:dihydrolipoyl dehydrogenase family protein n=1 Tax=Serpentinicella sp. ANB-PHB4 TaxID=3074076 RepID=UPI002855F778|nr:NAD(P)/FAD-dependent oxidoreductase [Serpentinicella sp. ANB-PHB4]MDR5658415.1 NAD(P)/FAD-dependent oxidoreductase [Serpentinicella sp. ANB-PHB4]